jgi:amino acid transporter
VRDPRRNLPRALVLGTLAVTLIYLLVNLAYLAGLGFDGARAVGPTPAALLEPVLGTAGAGAMNALIMIAVLGAISGMIFTGARIFSEMGADHRLFAPLGWWSPRWRTPVWSLLFQALLSIGMVVGVSVVWRSRDGFNQLLRCSAPVFWLFFLLTGLALFVLRRRDRDVERPFRVPLYPLAPLLFCGWCGFMLYGSLREARSEALIGLALLLAGVPLYLLSRCLPASAPPLAGPHCLSRQWSREFQGAKSEP